MKTVIVAQARMGSERLPGKTMRDLGGVSVLDRVVQRASRSLLADELWVATTTDPSDDVIEVRLDSLGVPCFRGSADDLLNRYFGAAQRAEATTVVRITCDCPMIDPTVIDQTIAAFRDAPAVDYCSNTLVRSYPIGMDTEVFTVAALERAHVESRHTYEREHVTPYIYQHPELFALRNVLAPSWATRPELRLTLDEPADLEMLRAIISGLPDSDLDLAEVMRLIEDDPSLSVINAGVPHRHIAKPRLAYPTE